MPQWPPFINLRDLAPGDLIPHQNLPQDIELYRIESADDPLFESAYHLLENEFSRANELELREVLINRLSWRADQPDDDGFAMRYELILLKVSGEIAAVRDHSAIVSKGEVTAHLSHVLVLPSFRRSGLATVLRTIPVAFARRTAAEAGTPEAPVTLLCEMEPPDHTILANQIRRISYEKAGFLTIPAWHGYLQPDFRAPALIHADPDGPQPVPLDLLFRRVDREKENELSGEESIHHIERIYQMYGRSFHPEHLAPCLRWFEKFKTTCPSSWPLLPPTEAK